MLACVLPWRHLFGYSDQDVEGDVQHVIGFMVRQVPLQQMKAAVDVADQPGVTAAKKTVANGSCPLAPLSKKARPASSAESVAPLNISPSLERFQQLKI
jgi:hypothetical protein